jgi:hypothetical protein
MSTDYLTPTLPARTTHQAPPPLPGPSDYPTLLTATPADLPTHAVPNPPSDFPTQPEPAPTDYPTFAFPARTTGQAGPGLSRPSLPTSRSAPPPTHPLRLTARGGGGQDF